MRNRAKCKLCNDVLESFHRTDYVECSCKEIAVDGGNDYFRASARDWRNFLRIDDEDNEIPIKFEDSNMVENKSSEESSPLTKSEKMELLINLVKSMENLPPQAMNNPITHYDLFHFGALIVSYLRDLEKPPESNPPPS